MRVSRKYKASLFCLPSPDGRLVATLLPTGILVRAIDCLDEGFGVVALPDDLDFSAVISFQWAPSSRRVLVATPELILVDGVVCKSEHDSKGAESTGPPFRALIRNPMGAVMGKPAYVDFGADDEHICLCSALGIKFVVFSLRTGKTVEVANPKLYSSVSICRRGFSFRPSSSHLALLTRTDGKDWVSVHDPESTVVLAAWPLETIDAQGLLWSPDSRWLAIWESPAHGHKIVFYTPDGHLFKIWTGALRGTSSVVTGGVSDGHGGMHEGVEDLDPSTATPSTDELLGSGVKIAQFSPNSRFLAIGDASRTVRMLDLASMEETQRLLHPTTQVPLEHPLLKVWQEQITPSLTDTGTGSVHTFVESVHVASPPRRPSPVSSDLAALASGCSLLSFDSSSAFLATCLDETPSTLWLWDVASTQLRAVFIFYASVTAAVWHPSRSQTLLIVCGGDKHCGLGFVWSSLSGAPEVADFAHYFPSGANDGQPPGSQSGKHRPLWLNLPAHPPSVFFSDGKEFALASLGGNSDDENGDESVPWQLQEPVRSHLDRWSLEDRQERPESPLELVPASENIEGDSEMDDTFLFKRQK